MPLHYVTFLADKCSILISKGVLICNLGICFERLDLGVSLRDYKHHPPVVGVAQVCVRQKFPEAEDFAPPNARQGMAGRGALRKLKKQLQGGTEEN
ncbi:hypothetical protein [Coxiella-like endosymbiont]|uniref:hypothetical protein n=1 Tax=Coxiella-like endosymbiont TaxID=1592897 RepID=UPI0027299395|nr:hypothetical protein [Coxiella-like endosymbiont]